MRIKAARELSERRRCPRAVRAQEKTHADKKTSSSSPERARAESHFQSITPRHLTCPARARARAKTPTIYRNRPQDRTDYNNARARGPIITRVIGENTHARRGDFEVDWQRARPQELYGPQGVWQSWNCLESREIEPPLSGTHGHIPPPPTQTHTYTHVGRGLGALRGDDRDDDDGAEGVGERWTVEEES